MMPGKGIWILIVAVIMLPFVAFLSIEGVQRYRYSRLEDQVYALVRDIQNVIKLDISKDGHIRMVAEADRGRGTFEVHGIGRAGVSHKEQTWSLTYLFDEPSYPLSREAEVEYVFAIRLQQDRRFLLLSPHLSADYTKTQDPLLAGKLDALIRARGLIVAAADQGF